MISTAQLWKRWAKRAVCTDFPRQQRQQMIRWQARAVLNGVESSCGGGAKGWGKTRRSFFIWGSVLSKEEVILKQAFIIQTKGSKITMAYFACCQYSYNNTIALIPRMKLNEQILSQRGLKVRDNKLKQKWDESKDILNFSAQYCSKGQRSVRMNVSFDTKRQERLVEWFLKDHMTMKTGVMAGNSELPSHE